MANSAEPARDGEIPPVVWMLPDRPGRGPKPAHSREQITTAAIRIADAEGLDAVTMRRVAAEVGSGTMTLYRYVPTKDHLLDLMIDATEGEVVFPDARAGDWRAGLRAVAWMQRDRLLRHPWLASLEAGRPAFGPNSLRNVEQGFGMLDGLELDIDQITGPRQYAAGLRPRRGHRRTRRTGSAAPHRTDHPAVAGADGAVYCDADRQRQVPSVQPDHHRREAAAQRRRRRLRARAGTGSGRSRREHPGAAPAYRAAS